MNESSEQICTPCVAIYSKNPDVSHFHIFGCRGYVVKPKRWREEKFDSRADEGILVEYCREIDLRTLVNDGTWFVE